MKKQMKRVTVLIGMLAAVLALSGCGVKQTQTEVTVEAGEEFAFSVTDFFDVTEETAEEFTVDSSGVDTSKIGDYTVKITYKDDEWSVTVHVEDTTEPVLTQNAQYVFTNNIEELDVSSNFTAEDVTECTPSLEYVKRLGDPAAMTDDEIAALAESTFVEAESEEDSEDGSDGSAKEESADASEEKSEEAVTTDTEGIYLARYTVTDEGGNTASANLLVIYDATAPVAEGLSDATITQEDVTKEPEIDLSGLSVTDNMDGVIPNENVQTALNETESGSHVYTLTLSCTDRAGNAMEQTYTYTVTAKEKAKTNSGSGSSSGNTTSENNASASSGSDSSASTSQTVTNTTPTASYNDSYAYQVLDLVNAQRAENGLSALSMNSAAMSAAKVRAQEITQSFSHIRPSGAYPFTALDEAGVSYRTCGENIAYGQSSPSAVVNAWMNSEGHRANILNGSFTEIGIGCYYSGGRYYWVQLFIG